MIINRDSFEIIQKIEDEDSTVIYCDPPYFVKGSKYVHDFGDIEHDKLSKLLSRFKKTRIIVSYYDHPKLKVLYKNWCQAYKATASATALRNAVRGKKPDAPTHRPTEVLLTNWIPEKEANLFDRQ